MKLMSFKELLKQKDIHAAQVARRLGIHRATVSRWSCGCKPAKKYIKPLAEILDVTVEVLLACWS